MWAKRVVIGTLCTGLLVAAMVVPAGAKAPPKNGVYTGLARPRKLNVTCAPHATTGTATSFRVKVSKTNIQPGGTAGTLTAPWAYFVATWNSGSVTLLKFGTWYKASSSATYLRPATSASPGPTRRRPDITLAGAVLGWRPEVGLRP